MRALNGPVSTWYLPVHRAPAFARRTARGHRWTALSAHERPRSGREVGKGCISRSDGVMLTGPTNFPSRAHAASGGSGRQPAQGVRRPASSSSDRKAAALPELRGRHGEGLRSLGPKAGASSIPGPVGAGSRSRIRRLESERPHQRVVEPGDLRECHVLGRRCECDGVVLRRSVACEDHGACQCGVSGEGDD